MVEATTGGMARSAAEAVGAGADLVELRLDWLSGLSEESLEEAFRGLGGVGVPKVATVMPASTFGKFRGSGEERAQLLMKAADHADYVDIGVEMGDALVRMCLEGIMVRGAKPIVSWHSDMVLGAGEIEKFIMSMPEEAVCKVVMPARDQLDNLRALEACASLKARRRIVFCHGSLGAVSRVLCPFFGSEWTYASVAKGREGAPGQLDVGTMRRLYEVLA